MNKTIKHVESIIILLEVILAAIIIIAVIVNIGNSIKGVYQMYNYNGNEPFLLFEELITNILLLIIGMELSLMLIKQSPSVVLDIMLFAVARKIILITKGPYEIAAGVIALAGIFAIKKYLYSGE
ncbi:MAG: hypothetical protein GX767_03005 [Firmicutes bacterium]|nr:hypothetical protein [Bacillota bacterium]